MMDGVFANRTTVMCGNLMILLFGLLRHEIFLAMTSIGSDNREKIGDFNHLLCLFYRYCQLYIFIFVYFAFVISYIGRVFL